jgi:peptidoglycan/LPS O-acetylase OafA/YrhL
VNLPPGFARLKSEQRLKGLDTLRAAAILGVLVTHYPKIPGQVLSRALNLGWVGVDLFFVLSGFLIGGQILKESAAARDISLKSFYVRRLLRTLPAYYVVLAIYFFLSPAPGWRDLLFAQNFDVIRAFTPSWSLCVEEQFYLAFPIVILALRQIRVSPLIIPMAALVSLAFRVVNWHIARPDLLAEALAENAYLKWIYYPTYCRLDGIAFGIGLAAIQYLRPTLWAIVMRRGSALLWSGLFLLALSIPLLWTHYSFARSTVGFFVLDLGFALLTASALSPASVFSLYQPPGARILAELAYSLYLTHSLALMAAAIWFSHLSDAVRLLASIATIATFAILLHSCVEAPMIAYRDRLISRIRASLRGGSDLGKTFAEAGSNAI